MPFIFGGDTGLSYDQLKQKQAIAEAMAANVVNRGAYAQNIPQGIAMLVQGIAAGQALRKGRKAMSGHSEAANAGFERLLGGMSGGRTGTVQTSAPSNVGNGDIAAGINESAKALGIDPVDLATAISYETAGTFDPSKRGPTTKWGQHQGLIQFGEPQAAKYGVDWNNPVGSQLGPEGAVVKYLRDTGVQPGMGLLDIYSAINAGGVGRYGASDEAAGGAPGTVRDKVNNQMAGHRTKAERLMNAYAQPAAQTPGQNAILAAISGGVPQPQPNGIGARISGVGGVNTPIMPPETYEAVSAPSPAVDTVMRGVAGMVAPQPAIAGGRRDVNDALLPGDPAAAGLPAVSGRSGIANAIASRLGGGQAAASPAAVTPAGGAIAPAPPPPSPGNRVADLYRLFANPALDPQRKAIVGRMLEDELKKSDPEYMLDLDLKRAQLNNLLNKGQARPMTDDERKQWGIPDDDKRPFMMTPNGPKVAGGTGVTVNLPGQPNIGKIPQGWQAVQDPETKAWSMSPIPGGPAAAEAEEAQDAKKAKQALSEKYANVVVEDIDRAVKTIEKAPWFTTGLFGDWLKGVAGTPAHKLSKFLDTVKANAGFDRLQEMRDASPTGGALGQVSNLELGLLQAAIGSLEQSQSAEDLTYNLRRVQDIYNDIIHGPGNWSKTGSDLPEGVSEEDLRFTMEKHGLTREQVLEQLNAP